MHPPIVSISELPCETKPYFAPNQYGARLFMDAHLMSCPHYEDRLLGTWEALLGITRHQGPQSVGVKDLSAP